MDQKKALIIIVVIAGLGLLVMCCIIVGLGVYAYQNHLLPGINQPVVRATLAPVSAPNRRPSPLPPTQAPPTAVPTPNGNVLRLWTFDQADGWSTEHSEGDYNVVDKHVANGKYDWEITARQPGNHQTYLNDLPEDFLPQDDYQISVEAQRLSGTDSAAYGVIFNYKDGDNFIVFLLNDMGNCLISQRSGGEWQYLSGGVQTSSAIRAGAVNYIDVKVSPAAIYAYINGQLAVAAEGLNLGPIAGTVGLSAELYNTGDTVHLQFDNMEVSHPAVFRK